MFAYLLFTFCFRTLIPFVRKISYRWFRLLWILEVLTKNFTFYIGPHNSWKYRESASSERGCLLLEHQFIDQNYIYCRKKDSWEWESRQKKAGTEEITYSKTMVRGRNPLKVSVFRTEPRVLQTEWLNLNQHQQWQLQRGIINRIPHDDRKAQNRPPERILGCRIQVLSLS